ncbi:MAG TPA: AgmX/PglI C-terminal domain-containing protein [Sandaracinaceae bacterium LLY-WYZ-13_1]|nr:AgmX/PglI C-terminal domain-containing protein [Sandaracinaceae bacterium LLY-WYZ-13_1]
MSATENPFTQTVSTPRSERTWGIAASGPPVDPTEVEDVQRAAEVIVQWGDEVLHVEHVSPPRDVVIGEAAGCDYLVGADALGFDRLPLVVEREGTLCCVVPPGAEGVVTVGDDRRTFEALRAEGALAPLGSIDGATCYPLPEDASARFTYRGFTFLVRPTRAGKATAHGAPVAWRRYGWVGVSVAVHAVFLMMFYFMPPSTQALSLDQVSAADRMVEYLDPAREVVEEDPVEWDDPSNEPAGGDGERHADEEGQSGDEDAAVTQNRYAVEGDPDDPNPELARHEAEQVAAEVGAIGAVRSLVGSWDTPTSPYGADRAHGNDPMSAIGALMGDQIGSNHGFNGLGMNGTGRGAGGTGLGTYGLGSLGTLGHGGGGGPGQGYGDGGYGHGVNLRDRERPSRVPQVRETGADVRGALSAEVIRRVVRRHLREVRFCYEQGLQSNPSIEGRVTVSWIIGATGAVQSASVSSTTLGQAQVERCITGAVRRWSFPQPDGGGVVGVNYPFVLQTH